MHSNISWDNIEVICRRTSVGNKSGPLGNASITSTNFKARPSGKTQMSLLCRKSKWEGIPKGSNLARRHLIQNGKSN